VNAQLIRYDDTQVFFFAAALALATFFLLLLIMTIPMNVPTTAEPRRVRKTGMRIAHTRGRKKAWRG
jgi:predicted small integral membrane protein